MQPKISFIPLSLLILVALMLSACDAGPAPEVDTEPDASEVEVTVEETAVPTVSDVLTETEVMTDTEVVTGAETITETPMVTGTEGITGAGAITGTEEMTGVTGASDATGVSGAEGVLMLAYALLDYDFVNQDGEVSGEIEDFLLDLNSGRILFVTLEYGGFLEIGDRQIVVPLSAFAWGTENELILNFDEQALENFPDVGDDWPALTDPAWDDEVIGFWNNIGINPGVDIAEASSTVMWAQDLMGYPLVDLGAGVGTIYNMIINLADSHVEYVLADFGTGADVGDPYILPLSAFSVEDFDASLVADAGLAFDAEITTDLLLTIPRFDRALYTDAALIPAETLDAVDTFWQEQGYTLEPASK
jgi:hypothetical protein